MSVPNGLYTLRCSPNALDAGVTDLQPSDPVGNLLSRPEIDEPDIPPRYGVSYGDSSGSGNGGSIQLVDPLSASVLSSTTSLTTNKLRLLTLHNPTINVELKNKSLITFSWVFDWEDMRFVWTRSRDTLSTKDTGYTCKLERKPDPDVAVALYKLAKRGNLVQILDYNLDRFQIQDRKGLEIVLISSLFSILQGDKLDEHTRTSTDSAASGLLGSGKPPSPRPVAQRQDSDEVETISPNEILISNHLSESAYTAHCINLLSDPNLIFLSLVAKSADTVPRAITVASEVKRQLLKNSNEDIMQFIDYPGRSSSTGRPAGGGASFADKAPPRQIKIYLSRIQLEEFVPQSRDRAGSNDEKDRLAAHYARTTGGQNGNKAPPQSTGTAGSLPPAVPNRQRLQKTDGQRPPLPPKNSAHKEEEGKKKSFWSRVMSD